MRLASAGAHGWNTQTTAMRRRVALLLWGSSSCSWFPAGRCWHGVRGIHNVQDGVTAASVVIADGKDSLKARDEIARRKLQELEASTPRMEVFAGIAHTVPYSLKVSGSPEECEEAHKAVLHCCAMCNEHLNHFNPSSEISKINAAPAGQEISISEELAEVLRMSFVLFEHTAGVFNPAHLPVATQLRELMSRGSDVGDAKVLQLLKDALQSHDGYASMQALSVDFKRRALTKRDSRTQLDLGGISKGFAVDQAIRALQKLQVKNAFVEWGGDLKVLGNNPSGAPWAVGVVAPPPVEELDPSTVKNSDNKSSRPYLRVVQLRDGQALATSGDYEQPFRPKSPGSLLSHIFDPRECAFVRASDTSVAQVTLQGNSCMLCDALATACMTFSSGIPGIRGYLDLWRHGRQNISDFTAFVRRDAVIAQMHQVARESEELRRSRISLSLPAKVVVVGGGLAGLSAAVEAAKCGASVLLLEKHDKVGGNSAKATSGINGWGTEAQGERDIQDHGKYFERDTHLSGLGGACEPGLVQVLSNQSMEAIRWLTSEFNIPLTVLSQLGGHSRPRTHRAPDRADGTPTPIGHTIIQRITSTLPQSDYGRHITIMTNATVQDILTSTRPDGHTAVEGVRFTLRDPVKGDEETVEYRADSVVLATGGFSSDRAEGSLMREFAPQLLGMPTTNGPFATGDGMKLARSVGAMLIDMVKVQLHPTGLLDPNDPANPTKYLGPEALRGSGGVLLNQHGKRFVNELDLRSVVSRAILEHGFEYPGSNGCKVAYCVLGASAKQLFGVNALAYYTRRLRLFVELDDVAALAKHIGCPESALVETLKHYGENSRAGTRCPFTGKSVYPSPLGPEDGPFTVALVTPSVHYTMGGVAITPSAEVIDRSTREAFGTQQRRTIIGLFAAGEVSGGVHGNNRLGGNSLLECVVFGRVAGDRAATILQSHQKALSTDRWSPMVLREVREGATFGFGSRILIFNFPGAAQHSGLALGQYVALSGEWDGRRLVGYYSPMTLPSAMGAINVLVRTDKGALREWLKSLKPGDAVSMKACGGLAIDADWQQGILSVEKRPITELCMIAGGSGIAPMVQLIRAALHSSFSPNMKGLTLLYAAEEESELTYREVLRELQQKAKGVRFDCRFTLMNPPLGWTEGVGYIERADLVAFVPPPSPGLLVVICGPPAMQCDIIRNLRTLGYGAEHVRTVDDNGLAADPAQG